MNLFFYKMYKGPNDKHFDSVIELGLKLQRNGLRIPYYTLLRLMDTTYIDMKKSDDDLAIVIDTNEELVFI